ncbi:MAG: putative DNA binding domain-containing protein [Anaerolineae bacterium]|nr:MAG: putative transcriptional regulator [Chloroflexi bacterium OLB13]MBC6955168.1 transcriptional regulator [Chloroflexota bacterium]MBV6436105.1 hypothetical protein [Anaerolineae bacterium]MDL1914846.1 transcriptional regulator [Anaerolineae bacterium CFX4]OQY85898.1 MAG: hypothetical protein B6D42_02445 [Anaerolineae bacterium UTCFX5]
MASRKASRQQTWYRADLHLHTPASADYQEQGVRYIDILRRADALGLDIIALTDHNTVAGYAAMLREVEQLEFLESLGRAQADELRLLAEYRRLLERLLVLPGFEFTATFGFHILGIFSPDTPIRVLEHLLLALNVPSHAMDVGSSEVGASSDVLTAYRLINEAGGLCIAAHVNSAHGVAMVGLDFGGQTRIAYTQDRNLHALEVTDLTRRDRRATSRFFDGTKAEYPRKMRCVQSSDAHRLDTVRDRSGRVTSPGIGERVTEYLLPERSFAALLALFQSADFSRSRPYQPNLKPQDYVQLAREEGPSVIQTFHESCERKNGALAAVIRDVCAFANTNGGTIYVGVSADKKKAPAGVSDPRAAMELLEREIRKAIAPEITVEMDVQETQGKPVVRIQVPFGEERPYAIEHSKIYVRDEDETDLAWRDEIVTLVTQGLALRGATEQEQQPAVTATTETPALVITPPAAPAQELIEAPRAGVEIVSSEERDGTLYYAMRDLRNGNIVRNVTRSSSRLLWHYAIKQTESGPVTVESVQWAGEVGLVRRYNSKGDTRYDLAQRGPDGTLRIYYGVGEAAMQQSPWQVFISDDS